MPMQTYKQRKQQTAWELIRSISGQIDCLCDTVDKLDKIIPEALYPHFKEKQAIILQLAEHLAYCQPLKDKLVNLAEKGRGKMPPSFGNRY